MIIVIIIFENVFVVFFSWHFGFFEKPGKEERERVTQIVLFFSLGNEKKKTPARRILNE